MKSVHTLSNFQQVSFEVQSGIVLSESSRQTSVQKQTKGHTNVSVVDVDGQSGTVVTSVPGQIYTETINTNDAWLQTSEGKVIHADFGQTGLPMRVGHHVTSVQVGLMGKPIAGVIGAKNHTTGKYVCDIELTDAQTWAGLNIGQAVFNWIYFGAMPICLGLYAAMVARHGSAAFLMMWVFSLIIACVLAVPAKMLALKSKGERIRKEIEGLALKELENIKQVNLAEAQPNS